MEAEEKPFITAARKLAKVVLMEAFWLGTGGCVGFGGILVGSTLARLVTGEKEHAAFLWQAVFIVPCCAAVSGATAAVCQFLGYSTQARRGLCWKVNAGMAGVLVLLSSIGLWGRPLLGLAPGGREHDNSEENGEAEGQEAD